MKAPISWLKKYVDIKLPLKDLMWKMTEVGMTTESFEEIGDEYVLDVEVTPNRPDWMSIVGIAREIAAIQNIPITLPKFPEPPAKKANLPFKINNDFDLSPRFSAITIKGVTQKPSPKWMQDYLTMVGLRPINNLIDITNYVMFELGSPIHVFDYDKLINAEMTVMKSLEGEQFTSVDGKTYSLPKDAIIFKSGKQVVDLCGIKGGENSGVDEMTKNVLIHVPVYNGQHIRRTSQRLSLWSEASRIFERGANAGGTVDTLKRATDLMLELAGGVIASEIVDVKQEKFAAWKLSLRISRLEFILGIKIPDNDVVTILKSLNLSPVFKNKIIECTIPTYRGDLKIEEDLIEEVARLYGYNNFPKTLAVGDIPVQTIPYSKDYLVDQKIKHLLTAAGFSEIQTYSLISEKDLDMVGINSENVLRIDNPVSREFEYLRPTLKSNLLMAAKHNKPFFTEIDLFEIGKVYKGKNVKEANEEIYIAGITNNKSYFMIKGVLERIFSDFNIILDISKFIHKLPEYIYFSFPYSLITKQLNTYKAFDPLPKYPPIIEDMAFIFPDNITVGYVLNIINKQSELISNVLLLDKYKDLRTFRIFYQHKERNLTSTDVAPIREKIVSALKDKGLVLK